MAWRGRGSPLAVILAACILPLLGADDNSQGIDLSESLAPSVSGRRGEGGAGKTPGTDAVAEGGNDVSSQDSLLLIGVANDWSALPLGHASSPHSLVSSDRILENV